MNIELSNHDGRLVVSSQIIAELCEIEHRSLMQTLGDYQQVAEQSFGVLSFQNAKPLPGSRGGRPERFALLSEDQATFLITLFRNTEPVVKFKAALVAAFRDARAKLQSVAPPALPGNYIEALEALVQSEKAKAALQIECAEMKPKADFFDAVASSEDLVPMGLAAKVLKLPFGRTTLFRNLRRDKILMEDNVPYQKYVSAGYFVVRQSTHTDSKGKSHIDHTTKVTGRGLDFLRRLYLPNETPSLLN